MKLLQKLHWLNFDTALGAVVTSLFIAQCLHADIPVVASVILLLAVLAIYNFDHLMDARRLNSIAHSARHRFYQQNQKALSIYQLLLMVGLITIIWYLPPDILRAGLVLALITGIYFILLFFIFPNRFLLKEIMIALVYTAALFLAPIYSGPAPMEESFIFVLWLQILMLAVSNTLIFAWYDHDIDLEEGHTSLAGDFGKSTIYRFIIGLLLSLVILTFYRIIFFMEIKYQAVILAMTLGLLFVLLANKSLAKNGRYRIIGDAIFITPVILLLI